jgi:hypothetical protein
LPVRSPSDEILTSFVGQVSTFTPANSNPQQPRSKTKAKLGFDTAIDTGGYEHTVAYPRTSVGRDRERSSWSLMATAGFAGAPGMSTAEQDEYGTSTVHQTITCHYHVYAPTTVHVSSGNPRCTTESSSEATSAATAKSSICEQPNQTDEASLNQNKLEIKEALRSTTSQGKREAILRWLVIKLTVLLEKVSRREKCVSIEVVRE